jgi:hypothetical protein
VVNVFRGTLGSGSSIGMYECETNTVTRPTNVIRRKDHTGAPTGSVGQPDFVTITGTLQLATTSSAPIQQGDYFSDTWDSAIGAETFIIESVTHPEEQLAYKKATFTAIKKYN